MDDKIFDGEKFFFNDIFSNRIISYISSIEDFINLSLVNRRFKSLVESISIKRRYTIDSERIFLKLENSSDINSSIIYRDLDSRDDSWKNVNELLVKIPRQNLENSISISVCIEDKCSTFSIEEIKYLAKRYAKIVVSMFGKFENSTELNIRTFHSDEKLNNYLVIYILSNINCKKITKLTCLSLYSLVEFFNDNDFYDIFKGMPSLKKILSLTYFYPNPFPSYDESEEKLLLIFKLFASKNINIVINDILYAFNIDYLMKVLNLCRSENVRIDVHGDLTASLAKNNFQNILECKKVYEMKYPTLVSLEMYDIGNEILLHEALKLSTNVECICIIIKGFYMYNLMEHIKNDNFEAYKETIEKTFDFRYMKEYKNFKQLYFCFQHWQIEADFNDKRELLHHLKRYIFQCTLLTMPLLEVKELYYDNIPIEQDKSIEVIEKCLPNIEKLFISGDPQIDEIDLSKLTTLKYFGMRGKFKVKLPSDVNIVIIHPLYYREYESDEDLQKYPQYYDNEMYYSSLKNQFKYETQCIRENKENYIVLFDNIYKWRRYLKVKQFLNSFPPI
uniref:F-box domain-containing protein n=1 Tax=Parastrongyloides trichosuri TaxID=131310 RepID=A0A0N4Z2G8_PARTI